METEQGLEWEAAQSITISVDLASAALRQLQFLATVDRNRWLYESPGLDRAIYRLNPGRYKSDCNEFYGRILDNDNVLSSLEGTSRVETEQVWNSLYSSEPYELDRSSTVTDYSYRENGVENFTKYDLILAAQRQSPFFYQVSRPHMNDHNYLEGAVSRYKGFLHLIKRNKERSIKSFSVPTYDIDLIWHTHQLHPAAYCKELVEIMGKVLDHDDTDSDRTKGQKLEVGFSATTKTYEDMFGLRYWRAGAMYRGSTPSPVRSTPLHVMTKPVVDARDSQCISLPKMKELEVMLEFVGVRNQPEGHKGSFVVSFSKTQPDAIFNTKREITILSETGKKQVATFRCEPNGHLVFELLLYMPSVLQVSKTSKSLGVASLSLEDFLSQNSNLMMEKWLEIESSSNIIEFKPIGLRVAISTIVPSSAPYVLQMISSRLVSKHACLFPMSVRVKFAKIRTHVTDEAGNLVLSLRMRNLKGSKDKRREIVGTTALAETCTMAVYEGSEWSLLNSPFSIRFPDSSNGDDHLLELAGPRTVRLYAGGRLDYESKCCEKHKCKREIERRQITAVEFTEEPYGRAVAVLDMKSGTVKIKEEWFVLPSLILSLILHDDTWKKDGCNSKTGPRKEAEVS